MTWCGVVRKASTVLSLVPTYVPTVLSLVPTDPPLQEYVRDFARAFCVSTVNQVPC